MSCGNVQKSLSAFLDRALSRRETDSVSQHLASCWDCAARLRELMELRTLLRNLPPAQVPERLATQLQVIASHAQASRATGRWQRWMAWLGLAVENLMRPIAIPFAGG